MRISDWSSDVCSSDLVLERLAGVLVQVAEHPFVDAVGHQQHLDVLGAEGLELRAAGGGAMAVGGDVPDRVLAGRHAADVGVQRHGLRRAVALGRCEAQQFRSEEHTSELQSLMRISYAVFCLKKKKIQKKKKK